ncbi:YadA-like family protein [Pseudomonas sp. NY15435]|uniref:YadA-like family protein n=1 Tax=Pseudomonas sp. NY15435 TaxID=3400358 RepID=UPI003A8A6264
MNFVYRSVWCEKTGTYVAASELAKGKTKSPTSSIRALLLAALAAGGTGFVGLASADSFEAGTSISNGLAVGTGSYADASGAANAAVAVGINANAVGNAAALGSNSKAVTRATAVGGAATADGNRTTALGYYSHATGDSSMALGPAAVTTVDAVNAVVVGVSGSASAANAVAIGASASATAANSVALGAGSTTTANLSQAGWNPGSGTLAGTASTNNGEVSIGSAGAERRLTNLAAGSAATDAVNVSQLQSEDAKVNQIGNDTASALGGGSTYNASTGQVGSPSYSVTNADGSTSTVNNVGDAITKLDGRTVQNTTDINNLSTSINNGSVGLVQQAGVGANLTVGKSTDGAAVDFAGTAGARKLINVADGTVASGSKDAVNGGQLFAVSNLATTTNRYFKAGGLNDGTDDAAATGKGIAVGAGATAISNGDSTAGPIAIGARSRAAAVASQYNSFLNPDGSGVVDSVAIGSDSAASGAGALAVGVGAKANFTNIAIGEFADTSGGARNTMAVGQGATSTGFNSAAIGLKATTSGSSSVALGDSANASASNSVALGANSTTTANLAAAGYNPGSGTLSGIASASKGEVSIGSANNERRLTNLAAGSAATDAVNVSQLQSEDAKVNQVGSSTASSLGGGSSFDASTGQISAPSYAVTNADGSTSTVNNVGDAITKLDGHTVQNTTDITNLTTNINNGSVGLVQQAGAGANLTVGKDTDGAAVDFAGTAGARKLINVADGTVASGSKDAVNGGQLFGVSQSVATAMGGGSTVNSDGSISAPSYAVTNPDGSTSTVNNVGDAISNLDGRTTQNTTDINSLNTTVSNMSGVMADAVTYDSSAHDKVTFGNAGTPVQLTNVKAGELSAASSDAVNGSQLFATNQQVGQNTADISSLDSRVTTNEGDISNLDGRVTNVEGDVSSLTTNINNGTVGLVQQAGAGANLTVGKDTDGAAVDFAGTAGARKLINVADGTVASGSKDAVNGGQLFGVSQSVATAMGGGSTVNSDGSISAPSYAVTNLDGSTSTVNNVGDAISNLDGRTSQNTTDINSLTNNINNGSVGLVQQSAAGENLTVGKDTDGAAVDFAGTAGARKLINVADGTVTSGSKDAVNGGQLFGVSQSVATAMGGGSTVNSDGSISAPSYAVTNLDGSTSTVNNVGDAISNLDGRTTQNTTDINSLNTTVTNIGSTLADAVTYDSSAHDKVTFGNAGTPVQLTNVKAGELSAASSDAVNGSQLFATNQQVGQNTTDINSLTNNINNGSVGLVQQSAAGENLTVGKDTDGAAVDFAGTAGARKLINVADGTVASGSKDAVNGGQLFGVSQSVATAMGGGSTVNSDGSISAPSYAVTNLDGSTTTVSNVGDAISNLDGRTTQNTTDINSINTAITSMTGVMGDAVMYDSAAHDKVTFGNAGTPVQLTNVKAGALTADSTDAVTGAQLFATNNQVSIIDGRVTNLEGSVTNIVNGGGIKYFHTSSGKADSVASGADAVAIGGGAQAGGSGSVALGDNAQATGNGNVALGQNASDAGRGAETPYVGKYSGANNDNVVGTVSVGNAATGETRTISNVADGVADNDAVNLRQLDGAVAESKSYTDGKVDGLAGSVSNVVGDVNEVKTRVTTIENNVTNLQNGTDGMTQVNDTSHRGKPKVTGTDSVAVGAGAESSGASSTALGNGARAKGKNSVAIGTDSVATRDNSVAVGSAGNERQITSVAAGTERTDAVNLGQMNDALSDFASQSDSRYNALRKDLHEQDDRLSAGIAGAIAIASLPQPMVNGGSTTSVGIGNFNGQSAVSVGVSHTTNDGKWTAKLGGSVDTQNSFSVGAGLGYNW